MAYGVSQLMLAARKTMHAMRRWCAFLHLSDPALLCQLFDTLVLLVLRCASKVWGVDFMLRVAAEEPHCQFLRQLLTVRKSTTTENVLADSFLATGFAVPQQGHEHATGSLSPHHACSS